MNAQYQYAIASISGTMPQVMTMSELLEAMRNIYREPSLQKVNILSSSYRTRMKKLRSRQLLFIIIAILTTYCFVVSLTWAVYEYRQMQPKQRQYLRFEHLEEQEEDTLLIWEYPKTMDEHGCLVDVYVEKMMGEEKVEDVNGKLDQDPIDRWWTNSMV